MKHLIQLIRQTQVRFSDRMRQRIAPWSQISWMPWAVLAGSLGFSAWAAYSVNAAIENAALIRFNGRANEIRQIILDRLQDNRQVLLAGAGLFSVDPNISRSEWRQYVSQMELEVTRPGILGVGFARALPGDPEAVERFAETVRAKDFRRFEIWPAPRGELNSTILYLEPLNERNLRAIGFNMLSEANRRRAMLAARDSGVPVSTRNVKLVQENGQQEQHGFLTYLPVYRSGAPTHTLEQRRANLLGWVYSPYRIGDLMSGIFPSGLEDVMFEIIAGSSVETGERLYQSAPQTESLAATHLQTVTQIPIGGDQWTLRVSALPNFYAPYTFHYASIVMLGGMLISFLLFGITRSLSTTRTRAIALARTMSEESRKSEQQMREITAAIGEGICVVNAEGLIRFANPQALRLLGRSDEGVLDRHVSTLFSHETMRRISYSRLPTEPFAPPLVAEGQILQQDGERLPVEITIAPLVHENAVTGSVFAFRDISSRILAEKALRESRNFRSLFDFSQDALLLVDGNGHIRDLNHITADFLGCTAPSLAGKDWTHVVAPMDYALFRKAMNYTLSGSEGPANRIECHLLPASRRPLPVEMVFSHMTYEGRKHVLISARDISQRRMEELMERETNRVLEMLLKGLPINDILATLIRAIEHQYSGVAGAVLLVDERGQHFSEVIAPNLPHTYTRLLQHVPLEEGNTSAARAVTTGQLLICENLERNEPPSEWRNAALQHGLRGYAAAPLFNAQTGSIGVFILHYPAVHRPGTHELNLIHKAARLAELAVERHRFASRIEYLATHDILTELPNRNLMQQRLDEALHRAQQRQRQVAVFFLDLDRFKVINDSLGHDKGDQLLQECARRLTSIEAEKCTVARLGGDEFVIVLEEVSSQQDAVAYARGILTALSHPVQLGEHQLTISTSIGISLFPDDATSATMLIKYADMAMYQSKKLGRNCYQFFDQSLNADAYERLLLETELREAVARGELELHYQPRIEAVSMRIKGLEALVRWRHPRHGLLLPARFVPLAEEMGLIEDIGAWVIQTACYQTRQWQQKGLPDLRISVNLSTRQLRDNRIIGLISEVLAQSSLSPDYLEIEITESSLMENIDTALSVMRQLERLGIKLSVDDFGTGYSSLNYLKKLPIHALKIDRSFVSELPADKDSMAIVNAIIAMAHSLGLAVIAEGVENDCQMQYLIVHHCEEMQGHWFGKPQPAEEVLPLLLENQRLTEQVHPAAAPLG